MKRILHITILTLLLSLVCSFAWADAYSDTKKMFEEAGIGDMLKNAYGYALFPTVGKAGIVIGGAYGEGRVYEQGTYIGNTTLTQATIGYQLGGAGFSQVILFEDKRALDEFTLGSYEFGVEAQATALTASAGAAARTVGSSAVASGGKNNAAIESAGYHKGVATFTITKGGLMYEASVGGQKFSYTPK